MKKYGKIKIEYLKLNIDVKTLVKAEGYDLRTTKARERAEYLQRKKELKKLSKKVNTKYLIKSFKQNKTKNNLHNLKILTKLDEHFFNQNRPLYKKYKIDKTFNQVKNELKKINKGQYKKAYKALIDDWQGDVGSNLKKYLDRFRYKERELFKKIIGKMSNKEIERRFAKYAVTNNISDLKYLFYPTKKSFNNKGQVIHDANEMLIDDEWRLDTLRKFTDIFLKTSESEKEYNNIVKVFDKIAKEHEEYLNE